MRRLTLLLATGFGLGLSPFASGTAGALLGVLPAYLLAGLSALQQLPLIALMIAAAIPICEVAERHFGRKDDRRIVADEYLTFPLCTLGLPLIAHPWVLAIAFVTNRFFDVIKPPPARSLQGLHGGVGIVIDDVFAALYSLALNHAICRFLLHVR